MAVSLLLKKLHKRPYLSHIERSLSKRKGLIQKITEFEQESHQPLCVGAFLSYHHLDPHEIYQKSSFRQLGAEAKLCISPLPDEEERITTAAKRLLHLNSVPMIRYICQFLATKNVDLGVKNGERQQTFTNILYYSLYSQPLNEIHYPDLQSSLNAFVENEWMRFCGLIVFLRILKKKPKLWKNRSILDSKPASPSIAHIPVIKFLRVLDIGLPKNGMLRVNDKAFFTSRQRIWMFFLLP